MISRNSRWLIDWWHRLAPIVNGEWGCNRDLCRDLAEYMGELGDDSPSDAAIVKAMEWEVKIGCGEKPWEEEK